MIELAIRIGTPGDGINSPLLPFEIKLETSHDSLSKFSGHEDRWLAGEVSAYLEMAREIQGIVKAHALERGRLKKWEILHYLNYDDRAEINPECQVPRQG